MMALCQWYYEGKRKYGHDGFMKAKESFQDSKVVDLTCKVYVVTGANAGLGFAITKELAKRGGTVHMLCRNQERAEKARNELIEAHQINSDRLFLHLVDLSLMQSVRDFATAFVLKTPCIDAFIHNAGVMLKKETKSNEGKEMTAATMLGGTHLLCALLLPLLEKSSPPGRIINVSSAGQYLVKLEPNDLEGKKRSGKNYNGTARYSFVKRAQVALTERWAKIVKHTGVTVHSMHPGWAESPGLVASMPEFHESNKAMLRTAEEGADTCVWLCYADIDPEKSGSFWFDREPARKHMPLSCTAYSEKDVDLLWENATAFCACPLEVQPYTKP